MNDSRPLPCTLGSLFSLEFPNCKHLKLPANYFIKNTNFLNTEVCPLLPYGEYPKTFLELFKWKRNGYIFLHFDFYNGACSTKQLKRLQAAIKEIGRDQNANVIVLMGGSTYFGNGINLNTIEVYFNLDSTRILISTSLQFYPTVTCTMHPNPKFTLTLISS